MIEETLEITVSIRGETQEDIEKTKANIQQYFAELQKVCPPPKRDILKEIEDAEDAMEEFGGV